MARTERWWSVSGATACMKACPMRCCHPATRRPMRALVSSDAISIASSPPPLPPASTSEKTRSTWGALAMPAPSSWALPASTMSHSWSCTSFASSSSSRSGSMDSHCGSSEPTSTVSGWWVQILRMPDSALSVTLPFSSSRASSAHANDMNRRKVAAACGLNAAPPYSAICARPYTAASRSISSSSSTHCTNTGRECGTSCWASGPQNSMASSSMHTAAQRMRAGCLASSMGARTGAVVERKVGRKAGPCILSR
mmetsp:Transcript_13929/g.44654  ORF Transcript_13929/g.44654 Transcript_13929/m.44654 type:complete len:254 (+) Transcript_13929:337-1098(+)